MNLAYYNENDAYCVAWLRNLIKEELIPNGEVDSRSICDVRGADLRGFSQCHFFAGLGGWAYATRLAQWPADRPIWTGSCPCQPFSNAGKRQGFADNRHLWPDWFRLICECHPATVFGEQVASPNGLRWFDLVCANLESENYAIGAADLCAAGVQAPHIRQRLWFVANSESFKGRLPDRTERRKNIEFVGNGEACKLVDAAGEQMGLSGRPWEPRNTDWILCTDGKTRPIESGSFPLAHGVPARVAKLRALGNAIVPQVAAEFISAFLNVDK